MTQKDIALNNVPEAIRWVVAAKNALDVIIGFNGQRADIANLNEFKSQKTHFHVELGPPLPQSILSQFLDLLQFSEPDPTLKLLKAIRFEYMDILSVLSRASSVFVDAPAGGGKEDVGNAPAFVPRNRDGTLRITPYYESVGSLVKVVCLIHEAAHFTSEAIQDYAYRDRTNDPDQLRYINLPVQYALNNADSYAYFALQMAKGIDHVLLRSE